MSAPSDLARETGFSAAIAATVAQGVAASGDDRWYLLAIGLFFALWAGMGVVKAARLISGLAWGVPRKWTGTCSPPRPSSVWP